MPRLYFPMICMIRIFISTYYYVWKNFAYQRIFQMMIQPKALYWSATLMQIHFPMGGLSPNLSNSKRKINPFSTKCFISIHLWFSDVFRGYRNGTLVESGLMTAMVSDNSRCLEMFSVVSKFIAKDLCQSPFF